MEAREEGGREQSEGRRREGRKEDGRTPTEERERRGERTGRKVVERREGGGLKRVSLGGKNIGGSEKGRREEKRKLE